MEVIYKVNSKTLGVTIVEWVLIDEYVAVRSQVGFWIYPVAKCESLKRKAAKIFYESISSLTFNMRRCCVS